MGADTLTWERGDVYRLTEGERLLATISQVPEGWRASRVGDARRPRSFPTLDGAVGYVAGRLGYREGGATQVHKAFRRLLAGSTWGYQRIGANADTPESLETQARVLLAVQAEMSENHSRRTKAGIARAKAKRAEANTPNNTKESK